MLCLHIERPYGPGVHFAETTDFLFEKGCEFSNQNLCAGCADTRQSDRLTCSEVLRVLCIHTQHT